MLGSQITVSNGFPVDEPKDVLGFEIVVHGIVNPSPAKTYTATVKLKKDSTEEISTSGSSIVLQPGTATCTFTLTNGLVDVLGSINVNFVSTYNAGTSSKHSLRVSLPTTYPSTPLTNINAVLVNSIFTGFAGTYQFELDFRS